MACNGAQTTGEATVDAAGNPGSDLYALAYEKAYGNAAGNDAILACKAANTVQGDCAIAVFAGIVSCEVTESGTATNLSVTVKLTVRWECSGKQPTAAEKKAAEKLACGVAFSVTGIKDDAGDPAAAKTAAQILADKRAEAICKGLESCSILTKLPSAPAGAAATGSTWRGTYTGSYMCVAPPPAPGPGTLKGAGAGCLLTLASGFVAVGALIIALGNFIGLRTREGSSGDRGASGPSGRDQVG